MPYRIPALLFVFLLCAWCRPVHADTLAGLRPEHPRVLATEQDFERIKDLVANDPLAKQWYAGLKVRGAAMLDQPVTRRDLRDGRRLLYESREVLSRVKTLGLLYQIEPDVRYRKRIWADMKAAAAFKDWNPDHFLDVAEMGLAFALAYDWLYDDWTRNEKQVIREAIVTHALKPALRAYDRKVWWTRTAINWNQVCNGGLIAAALAIADQEPQLATQMIERSTEAIKISMARYAPDGGYDEGPGYWSYGTVYNVIAIAALESALGKDFGLGALPGFEVTGGFPLQMTGPTGRAYNFGDGKDRAPRSPAMFFLAKRYDHPAYARFAAERNRGSVLDLLWYDPDLLHQQEKTPPLAAAFTTAGVAVLRSAWEDKDAWYVGAKGGEIGHGHSQQDLGSFILERHGVRWLIDLGADNYNLPGYFASQKGGKRWDYYRNRAEGHNTLVINPGAGPDQPHGIHAPIRTQDHTIQIDLDKAYAGKVHRSIHLDMQADRVRVVDQMVFDEPAEVWWFAHTRARVTLDEDGRGAALEADGKQMRVKLVAPADARFKVMDARPLPTSPDPVGQNPNNGASLINAAPGTSHVKRGETPRFGQPDPVRTVRRLAIQLIGVTDQSIEVVFESVAE